MAKGFKTCPACSNDVGGRALLCKNCGHLFEAKKTVKKAKPKKVKKAKEKPKKVQETHGIKKIDILERLILDPPSTMPVREKSNHYRMETKFLNDLIDRYSIEFMNVVRFNEKFDSFKVLLSPKFIESLDRRFRCFNYVVDKSRYPEYNLGEKSGEDRVVEKKRKTLKDFLDEK